MRSAKKYLITLAVGFAGVLYVLWLRDFFGQTETAAIFRILCDAFFVVGVVITCIGLLIFSSNEGTFDGMVYAVKSFLNLFRKSNMKTYNTYYDYKAANANRKAKFGFLLICGVFFVAVSLVALYFYHMYS